VGKNTTTSLNFILNKYKVKNKAEIELYCSRRITFPKLFRELGFKIGVEVGVAGGKMSKFICESCPDIKLYSVDAWTLFPDAIGYTQEKMDKLYEKTKSKLSYFSNNQIVRAWSMDAVKQFKNNSLDFVYIDAAHDYKNVYQDIREWSKKVRKGGLVCGDDYIFPEDLPKDNEAFNNSKYAVKKAVIDWVKVNNIKSLFVLTKGMIPNWFYVKE